MAISNQHRVVDQTNHSENDVDDDDDDDDKSCDALACDRNNNLKVSDGRNIAGTRVSQRTHLLVQNVRDANDEWKCMFA